MKALQHLQTINHHKYLVMKECFEVGLYKQGLLHDMSKYSPTEFLVGCKYYQGNRSPNNAEREATGYSRAWLHHKGRNKHHYEYWIDYSVTPGEGMVGLKMPLRYVVEMFMDRIALHQANRRIIEAAAKRVGVEIEKFPMNLGEYANTSAASVPILLNEMNRDGKLKRGQKIILAGFGAGLTWAGCLMEW